MTKKKGQQTYTRNKFVPRNEHQRQYAQFILDKYITLAYGPAGSGKAQPLDSLVYTPTGPKTMGEIRVGDKVCTPDGKTANVLQVHPQGKKKVYKITFNTRDSVECCEDHLWTINSNHNHNKEITADLKWIIQNYQTQSLSVEVPDYVYFEEQEVAFDPYLMGCLIGDGGLTQAVVFTSADKEMIGFIEQLLPENLVIGSLPSHKYGYSITSNNRINTLKRYLASVKLNVKSHEKSIPDNYIYNSYENRVKLLQGLMDTDGSVSDDQHTVEFSTTSNKLAIQVKFLVESIGGTCTISDRITHFTSHGKKKAGKLSYRCFIHLNDPAEIFRLTRKKNRCKKKIKYFAKRYIKNIEFSRETECQCISIDSDRHLYITDNCIVTHNSHCCVAMAVQALTMGLVDKIVITRPVVEAGERLGFLPGDMESKLMPYLMPIYDELSKYASLGEINAWKHDKKLIIEPLAFMRGRTFDKTFLIADEMQNATWTQVKMILTRIGQDSKFILNGDHEQTDLPTHQQGAFLWVCENFVDIPEVGVVKFEKSDIIRNPVIGKILDKFDLWNK